MAETDLSVICNRAGNAEGLKSDADCGSGGSGFGATLLQSDCGADGIRPDCVFKADRLGRADDAVHVDSLSERDFLAFINRGDAVFFQNAVDFINSSLISFK